MELDWEPADSTIVRAWRGDTHGNLIFRMTARNFSPHMAMAAKVAVVEVDNLVPLGALAPDDGSVTVFGTDPTGPGGESVRRRCGVVSAKPSLYDRLSGQDNLRYAAELYGLGRGSVVDDRIAEGLATLGPVRRALLDVVGRVLHEAADDMLAWRRHGRINQRWDDHVDIGPLREIAILGLVVSFFEVPNTRCDSNITVKMRSIARLRIGFTS